MNKETLLMFRNEILKALMNKKVPKEIELDKLDIECLMLQLLDPENFEDNRKVLRKNYYENQRWNKKR